jgi:hypothetical protein
VTVQELVDWLEGILDPDGVEGVDPDATVRVMLREPSGEAFLRIESMSGDMLLQLLDPVPVRERQG